MSLNKLKLINISIAILLITLFVSVVLYIRNGYCLDSCDFSFKNGIVDPFYLYIRSLIITISIFIFLPTQYFKNWLIWIASWTLPISLFLIAQESPYSTGGFLKLSGRPFMAEMTGYIVCGVSIIFIIVYFVYTKFLKRKY